MPAFYKVILNGSYKGKDNLNTLYYRAEFDPMGGNLGFGGANELADQLVAEVVPAYLACKPAEYTLQTIDIVPRNAVFELMYQLPYRREVNLPGNSWSTASATDGPALCCTINFNLEPQVIGLQAFTAPKRGYVSVGPLNSVWVDDSGKLDSTIFQDAEGIFRVLCDKLSQDLISILPPAAFAPIRVAEHYGSLAGSAFGWGYADVQSATVDEYVSFRRSRRIKG